MRFTPDFDDAVRRLCQEYEADVIRRERARILLLVNQATPDLLSPKLEEAILSGKESLL